MKVLETERLNIRWITLEDAAFVVEILNSKGWLANIGDRMVRTIKDAEDYISNKMIGDYQRVGFGMYVLSLKETNRLIGMSGFVDRPGLEGIDLGFALLDEYHGMGFAYEANRSLVDFAKELDIKLLKAITLPSNLASRKLLEKLDFKLIKKFYMENDPELLCLYELGI